MKNVALIEFNTWHQECLYPQLLFLTESGYQVLLVNDIRKKEFIESLKLEDKCECLFFDFKKLKSFFQVRKELLSRGITDIILNTAQGSGALKFSLLPFFKKMNWAGTLHNIAKLDSSFGQKLIARKVKKYYLLADYLTPNFPKDKGYTSAVFEPIFLPEVQAAALSKPQDEVWICIPGYVEYKRRDYDYLLTIAKQLKQETEGKKVKFVILGNAAKSDGPRLLEGIKTAQAEDYFITFDHFIPEDVYEAYIKQADLLLPLIHPETPGGKSYTNHKISGTFSLAAGYGKIMLCHAMFEGIDQFNYAALFYNTPEEFIKKVGELDATKQNIKIGQPDFEKNRKNYIALINQ